jgi:hypothetical protein
VTSISIPRKYAMELVALAPEVILASGGSDVGPLLQVTRSVPVVFTQTPDPVAAGFVASLARPGGNATDLPTRRLPSGFHFTRCAASRRCLFGSVIPNMRTVSLIACLRRARRLCGRLPLACELLRFSDLCWGHAFCDPVSTFCCSLYPLRRRQAEPHVCAHIVLRHALVPFVHDPEIVLSASVASISKRLPELHRSRVVAAIISCYPILERTGKGGSCYHRHHNASDQGRAVHDTALVATGSPQPSRMSNRE